MKRFTKLVAASFAVMLAAAGAADAAGKVTISIGGAACLCYLPTVLAKQLGEYEKAGVDADLVDFKGGSQSLTAVLGGSADVVSGYFDHTVELAAKKQHLQSFVVYDRYPGLVLVVAPGETGKIKSVKDLKGKKVGVTRGGIHEVLLDAELGQNGLSAKDVTIVYLAFADLNQALLGKNIDAMMQSEPQSSQAINKGFGVEVMKPYDTPIGEPYRTMVMTEKFYTEKRPLAEKFMRCFLEATKTFIDKPEVAEKYVREVIFKNQITKEDFYDAIGNSPYAYDITVEHIQVTTDTMAKYGTGKMAKPPVAKDWVKTDLLEQAKKSMNLK